MKKQEKNSTQNWLPFETILEQGIIKLKNNSYIKILKIMPINYNLKSDLEKESIINSYKIFLKTCNFNFQILIQSNKQDLSQHISHINSHIYSEKNTIQEIGKKYIQYIQEINNENKSSSKNFYLIIQYHNEENLLEKENYAREDLNDKYFKIKDCLARCGNAVQDINNKKEIKKILFSFFNTRMYFDNNQK